MENQHSPVIEPKAARLYNILSALTAFLVLIATVGGLALKDIYVPFVPAPNLPAAYGQDLALLLTVPILILSLSAWRHSPRGLILQAGILLYVAYSYAIFVFLATYTEFFLIYIALVGLPIYTLIGIVTHIDGEAYRNQLKAHFPNKVVSLFLMSVAVLVTVVWIAVLLQTMVTHTLSVGINSVYVVDLALLLPACMVAAIQLWRRQTWGYFLSGVLLVMVATEGLTTVIIQLFASLQHGELINAGRMGLFGIATLAGIVVLIIYLRNVQEDAQPTAA